MTSDLIDIAQSIGLMNQRYSDAAQQQQLDMSRARGDEKLNRLMDRFDALRQTAQQRAYKKRAARRAKQSQTSFSF